MSRKFILPALALALSFGASALSSAKSITLPPDGIQLKASPLP